MKSGNCYDCKNYQNCKWLRSFNMDKEVGCIDFTDEEYIEVYTTNTLNNNEQDDMTSKEAFDNIVFSKRDTPNTSVKSYVSDVYRNDIETVNKALATLDGVNSKTRLFYKDRRNIAKEFDKWCIDNNVENCSESMATWFLSIKLREWLKSDK